MPKTEATAVRSGVPPEPVKVSFLGRFQLEIGGQIIDTNRPHAGKLWSVLCFLLTHRYRQVAQQELIDLFWAGENVTNPNSALKTLIHRIRALLNPCYPELRGGVILYGQDGYIWNPAIECEADIDRFAALCVRAAEQGRSVPQRIELSRQAIDLYQGDFLPMFSGQMWVTMLSEYYHTLYIGVVKDCAHWMERAGDYTGVVALCARASEIDAFEEAFHLAALRAYFHQGQYELGADHYHKVVKLYRDSLGAAPSEALQTLGAELMHGKKANALGVEALCAELRETSESGTFVCDYAFFRQLYQLEVRRMMRTEQRLHLAMITMTAPRELLTRAMDDFLEILRENLRSGDVVSRCGESQYTALLANTDTNGSEHAVKRALDAFHRIYPQDQVVVAYQLEEIGTEQELCHE